MTSTTRARMMDAAVSLAVSITLVTAVSAHAPRTITGHGVVGPALQACTEEDGSMPGQAFPCRWDATLQGNGQGESYTLTEPATCAYARMAGPAEGC